ncbi:MAG: hypothetical protein HY868_16255 [Chloroflexi bacterium]|nr:hypothetical protein [Chloroflexota bacterium]
MSVLLLVIACIIAGVAIRFLRRWPRLVFIATLLAALTLGAIIATASDAPFSFFGRALALDASSRVFLIPAVAIAAALAFFGPLNFDAPSTSFSQILVNSQGAFLFWSLAPLIVAIAIDSFPLAIFFWALGLIVLMLLAQPRREGNVGGAAQFILVTVIAVSSLLLASRLMDLYPLTPENLELIRTTVILLALGLGILLAVAPFHVWLGPLADEIPALGVAFLAGVAQPVGVWLLFQRMNNLFWLTDKSPLFTVLLFGGALTVPVGALLAITEQRDGRLIAYLALVSLGHALIGLGLNTPLATMGALAALFDRALGVALVAGGFSFVRHHPERRWQSVGALAILLGGMTLAGVPPTPGFAARWVIYREFAATNVELVALLAIANAAVFLATVRVVWGILNAPAPEQTDEVKVVPYLSALVVALLVVCLVVAGLAPQPMANVLTQVIETARYLK